MTIGDWIRLGLALVGVGVVAFTTAVLVGFGATSRSRLSDLAIHGDHRARTVDDLLERSHYLQSAMLILDTAAVGTVMALVAAVVMPKLTLSGIIGAVAVAVAIVIIFGRAVPRAVALRLPEQVAVQFVQLARIVVAVLRPVTFVLEAIARAIIALFHLPNPSATTTMATEEELIQLVREEAGDNRIEEGEVDLVNSIFRFTDTTVREVMVPRVDMTGVSREATIAQAVAIAREAGHSRLPVYAESLDNIVGVVYAKDFLRFVGRGNVNAPILAIVRPPLFVPDGKPVAELLRELQVRRVHLAIVVDEYGGTAGLVTIEDIIEEIVGDIQDEYDTEVPLVESLPDGAYHTNARLNVGEVARLMGTHWTDNDEEREPIGGIIYDRLGHIPVVGEQVRIDDLLFTVVEMDNQRLEKLRVEPASPETDAQPLPLPPDPESESAL